MLSIYEIQINYQNNPIGILGEPQFLWKIKSDKQAVIQTAYQLQLSKCENFTEILFDSEKVRSEASAQVMIEKQPLESLTPYFIRIRVWDNYGEQSDWSESARFVTAILKEEEWKATYISAETQEDASSSKGTYVKHSFDMEKEIVSAYVCSTALGLYQLYLNGEKVGQDQLTPGWTSYHQHLLYQVYDVTTYIGSGKNEIKAMLGAGWYKGLMGFDGIRNHYGNQTALLAQLCICYTDGTKEIICTNEHWQGANAPVVFAEIYDGEIYDARLEDPVLWKTVRVLDTNYRNLYPQSGGTVQKMDALQAIKIWKTPKGEQVVDFGQNLTGWVSLHLQGENGTVVKLKCFEILDGEGNVYTENLREAKQELIYICKDNQEVVYEPHFTFQGFRYVQVVSYPGMLELDDICAYAVHTNMKETGRFTCANPDVNQLQHNIKWGLKGNFVDVPTDCPQRDERLGWTGDAQIFCRTATYLMDTYTFFGKWLKDLAADQTSEGGVPHVVPDIITGKGDNNWLVKQGTHSAAAWADAAVINPWVLYQTYGDKRILEEQYHSMKAWIDFMKVHAKDYIWNYQLQFGDWVALDAEPGSYFGATPNDLTCTAYYAYSTRLFAEVAKALDKFKEYQEYSQLAEKIVNKFQSTFFDAQGTLYAQTQTAHILALYFDLTPEEWKERTIQGLLRLLEKEKGHLVTGFVGTPYFCHALSENGHTKEAYDLLLKEDFPSWLYQVKMGATTIWEHWDGIKEDGSMWSPDMNSFNHYAYGAIGEWLYRVAAGIEINQEQPGYKHGILYPHPDQRLQSVSASYETVYGKLGIMWKLENKMFQIEAEIPVNTTATIILEKEWEVVESKGLVFKEDDGVQKAWCGSGKYWVVGKAK